MIGNLRAANANYERNIAFVYVDWDKHSRSAITKELNVYRQSTLVMMTNKGELGRLVAQTSESSIRGLLDKAPPRSGGGACTS